MNSVGGALIEGCLLPDTLQWGEDRFTVQAARSLALQPGNISVCEHHSGRIATLGRVHDRYQDGARDGVRVQCNLWQGIPQLQARLGIEEGDFAMGMGGETTAFHYEDGVRVLDAFRLYEVSMMAGPPNVLAGTYPIEFIDETPCYTVEGLAAIWAPLLGEEKALAYAQRTYGQAGLGG